VYGTLLHMVDIYFVQTDVISHDAISCICGHSTYAVRVKSVKDSFLLLS